ncbi:MAG: MaoC family dehydratase [Hyphomicrobiaceae bacterium]|nr:MaoC family dehydratase [Hyphomicrobiaceae bacterium]
MDQQETGRAQVAVGQTVVRAYTFTRENIADYARMAGDTNPLHLDPEVAIRSRFEGIIAAAAHSTGVLVSVLADAYAKEGQAVGLGFAFQLRRAVPAGAVTRLEWTITSLTQSDRPRGRIADLSGQLTDADTGLVYVTASGQMLFFTPAGEAS